MSHACDGDNIGARIAENEVKSHQSRKRANKKRKKKAAEDKAAGVQAAEDSGSDEPPVKKSKGAPTAIQIE